MKHQFPITVFYSDDPKIGRNMTHFDVDLLVWSGERESPGDCLTAPCTNNYDLE